MTSYNTNQTSSVIIFHVLGILVVVKPGFRSYLWFGRPNWLFDMQSSFGSRRIRSLIRMELCSEMMA